MKTVTLEELRRHNSASDAWLSIHGEVYDVTEFAARHPGGQVIVEYFGTECTDQFELFHTPSIAKCWLKSLHVGKLVDPAEVPPSTQQYRALRQKLWEAGMFRAEPSYFIMKALAYLSILAIAYLCVTHDNYFVRVFLGGALLGLGWHQGAFIAHDACHLGVVNHCPRSKRGPTFWNRVIGWFQASVIFGISYNKWLREHNEHHAYTHRPLKDPQFIYLPVFLQSMKELQIKGAPQVNFLMRALVAIQKYTFLPLCVVIGRVNFYAVCLVDAIKYGAWMDIVGMAVYWSWVSLYFRHLHSSSELAVFFAVSHVVAGILHVQLLLSHLATPQYTPEEEEALGFFEFQLRTSRNIKTSWWSHWFHGGLEMQIEHHLFPMLPRHNLRTIAPMVRQIAKDNNIPYLEAGFFVRFFPILPILVVKCTRLR
ncbi:MAG: hypothetical protein MHM6MM_000788 [Cercozoa sp. M6MM]